MFLDVSARNTQTKMEALQDSHFHYKENKLYRETKY